MSRQYRPNGGLEDEVLGCLAGVSEPLTVAAIKLRLDEALAYTTISTTLNRLYEQGLLRRQEHGRAFAYALALPPEAGHTATTAHQMYRLLASCEDHAAVLSHFVAELSPEEAQLLVQIVTGTTRKT